MLKVNSYSTSAYRGTSNQNTKQQSFGAAPTANTGRKAFEWLGKQCNIDSNGSLTRTMFFVTATLFMLGGRFFESRDNDEKREVVTRDIPAVALSCGGAPLINNAIGYLITKKSGIPIVTLGEKGTFGSAKFSSQKQLIDWYSDLAKAKNPLVNFSETISKNGGNLQKAFKKLGLTDQLKALTDKTGNKEILEALKDAQNSKKEAFTVLENSIKGLTNDNALLKFARKSQSYAKLGVIGFMAALLGYFLPHLNIVTTKKKYEGKVDQKTLETKLQRKSPVFRVSNGVLSFHRASAQKTFKPMFSMFEDSYNTEK